MKIVTQDFKDKMRSLGKEIEVRLTIGETILTSENLISFNPAFQGDLFKSVMKELYLTTYQDIPLNTILKAEFGVLIDNEYEYINFGNYVVYKSEKVEDMGHYQITLYDKLLYSMKEYDGNNIAYPITVENYLKAIFNKIGLNFISTEFANKDRIIPIERYDNTYTYRDILDELSAVVGGVICLDGNDNGIVKYPTETNQIFDEEDLKDVNVLFSKKYGVINSLVLSRSAESDNIYLKDDESIAQNGITEVKIKDNQIMNFNDRVDYMQEIFDKINGLSYYVNDFSSIGIGYLELLDKYDVVINEISHNCLLLNDSFIVDDGVQEDIYTDEPETSVTDYTKSDTTDRKMNNISLIVDKQNLKIEQIAELVEEISNTEINYQSLVLNNCANVILHRLKITGNDGLIFPSEKTFIPNVLKSSKIYLNYGTNDQKIYDLKIPYLRKIDLIEDEYEILEGKAKLIKRIGLNENLEPYILDKEQIIDMGEVFIELSLGENNIWFPKFDYVLEAEYLLINKYTDSFSTIATVKNEIEVSKEGILLEAKSYTNNATRPQELVASLNLLPTGEAQLIASKVLDLESLNINLTAKNMTINSDNFSVDSTGKVIAIAGDIGGFKMDNVSFTKDVSGLYEYSVFDLLNIQTLVLSNYTNDYYNVIYDLDKNNVIDIADMLILQKDILNVEKIINNVSCKFEINSNNPKKCVSVKTNNGKEIASMGIGGIESNLITCEFFTCGNLDNTDTTGAKIKGNGKTGTLTCVDLIETSLEKNKKNFEKLENALDIIEEVDIYKYNLKSEDDKDKKHIGFVIGDDYKYSRELTNNDNTGVNAYGLSSVNTKAIQELYDIIKIQQNKIDDLEEKLKELK